MFRIDSPGAGPGNTFTEGDPQTATPATVVSADWLQAVQDELANAIEAAGLTLVKADSTQLTQAIRSLAPGGGGGNGGIGANELINGDFGIMQRATSAPSSILTKALAAATTAYAMDRWQSSSDGGGGAGTATITRQAFTAGQTAVPRSPKFYGRHQQTVASTVAAPFMRQKVEDVARFQGVYTLSIYLLGSGSLSCSLRITQKFGTGGSADVVVNTTPIAVTTSWARYTVTVTLPSVSGKTITADSHLLIEVLFPSGSTFTIDLADAQLEAAPSATGFQRRARSVELALCQRFYEKSWPSEVAAAVCPSSLDGARTGYVHNTGVTNAFAVVATRFRVEKRGTPTVAWQSPIDQAANAVQVDGTSRAAGSNVDEGPSSTGYPGGWAGSTAGFVVAHWTADAEL